MLDALHNGLLKELLDEVVLEVKLGVDCKENRKAEFEVERKEV